MSWILALALPLTLWGCGGGSSRLTVHVEPIDSYRGYADFQPEADKAVLVRAAAVDPAAQPIRIFQEALPEGIAMREGAIGVVPGYGHKLIGKFAYSPGRTVSKAELVARVKRNTIAAGGNAAVVIFIATDSANYDLAQGIEAIVIHWEPGPPQGAPAAPPPDTRSL